MKALLVGTAWCLFAISCFAEETPSATDKSEAEAAPPAPVFQLIIRPSTAVKRAAAANSSAVSAPLCKEAVRLAVVVVASVVALLAVAVAVVAGSAVAALLVVAGVA